ncbi:MAG: Cerebroside-sulfatase [Planctomycetaceae bacterium]|nr:Cerebroside-sulfatase [Planctomycetaceae bacterium]
MKYVATLIALLAAFFTAETADAARPNIVFILADDLGYGDVQANNPSSKIPTPNLNRLAKEGLTFSDAHSPSAVCTPTRYATLTGRYCWRSKLKRGVLNGYSTPLIESGRSTVASFLKQQDYHTGIVGKWHLGLGFQKNDDGSWAWDKPLSHTPNHVGFDDSYVIPASLDFPPYVYIENARLTKLPTEQQPKRGFPAFLRAGPRSPDLVMEECLDHLTDRACGYIQQRSREETPFFLYFPLTAPHKPVLPHPRFRGKTKLGPYGDFVVQVDATVGRVLDALERSGLKDKTLVFFTSDNGSFMHRIDDSTDPDHVADETVQAYRADHHTANHVYRGTKADVWEAGHRVPYFVRWPGVVTAGTKCDEPITHADLFATLAAVVGAKLPPANDAVAEDSRNLLPLLRGNEKAKRGSYVINHSAAGMFAIRDGKWKLVLGSGSGGRERPAGKRFERPYHLFDLDVDPRETTNLVETHPQIARRLERQCLELIVSGRSR